MSPMALHQGPRANIYLIQPMDMVVSSDTWSNKWFTQKKEKEIFRRIKHFHSIFPPPKSDGKWAKSSTKRSIKEKIKKNVNIFCVTHFVGPAKSGADLNHRRKLK